MSMTPTPEPLLFLEPSKNKLHNPLEFSLVLIRLGIGASFSDMQYVPRPISRASCTRSN